MAKIARLPLLVALPAALALPIACSSSNGGGPGSTDAATAAETGPTADSGGGGLADVAAGGDGSSSGDGPASGGDTGASCTFNGMTVASGSDVTPDPYVSASVPSGQTCMTEKVTCDNGVLTPSGASPTCTVSSATVPTLRQFAVEQTNGGSGVSENDSMKQFSKPTQKGSAIWVVATIPNDGGQANVTLTDTQGNDFKSLDFEQDTSKGMQSVWHFYAASIKGDTGAADTVTVHWASDNYKGVVIAELAGVTATPLVGHAGNRQDENAPSGDNGVTSGMINVGAADTPALLLALSMDTYGGYSDTGGDDQAGPTYGTGFDGQATIWNWSPGMTCTGGIPCNLASLETKSITAAGNASGLFTARAPQGSSDPGTYVTVAAVFH